MLKCRKVNRLVYIGIVMAVVLCVACGCETDPESAYRTEDDQDAICGSEPESDGEGAEVKQHFSYFINWEGHFSYPSAVYQIGEVKLQPYYVPVLLVEISDDRQKEERINRMLLEHYVEVLPDAEEE